MGDMGRNARVSTRASVSIYNAIAFKSKYELNMESIISIFKKNLNGCSILFFKNFEGQINIFSKHYETLQFNICPWTTNVEC